MGTRKETDTMGEIEVPMDRLWGAQTQRSLQNFSIGTELIPMELVRALALIKRAAATVNRQHYRLPEALGQAIERAADEILRGEIGREHFPLVVWQTGSGTQTNMNLNEVIANRANIILQNRGQCHPNDHVNMHQSSNDAVPSAMHVAVVLEAQRVLVPGAKRLLDALDACGKRWVDVIKIGRTHLQDAVPITFGQEFSAYARQVECGMDGIHHAMARLYELAQGGTAVGTGLNAPFQFDSRIAEEIARLTHEPFRTGANKFELIATQDGLVHFHGALNSLAVSLLKIANDVRLAGSGPRCGFGELLLPQNEPGSSIMPGKVNPTQCEAVSQVCVQVLGNNVAVGVAGSSGHFELNAFKPVILYNVLQSTRLLGDACASFAERCIEGLEVDQARVKDTLGRSLMLVTALSPHIGYARAASVAKCAHAQGLSLRAAALQQGVSEADFDKWVVVENMLGPFDCCAG